MLRMHSSIFKRVVSSLPVLIILTIILVEVYNFWSDYLLAPLANRPNALLQRSVIAILFHLFLSITLVSYYRVSLADPGYVTSRVLEDYLDAEDGDLEEQVSDRAPTALRSLVKCHKCDQVKPFRAHHCSMCNRCVLAMDHHCPWVANCIGAYNYKFFVHFIFYGLVTSLFILSAFFQEFYNTFQNPRYLRSEDERMEMSALYAYVLLLSLSVGLLTLLVVHTTLIAHGATIIECSSLKHKSRYSRGWRQNFIDTFGKEYMGWLLPIRAGKAHQHRLYVKELRKLHGSISPQDYDECVLLL